MVKIFALGGDALSAPQDTLVAYWSALAAGVDGLALHVRESDGKLYCAAPQLGSAAPVDVDAGGRFMPGSTDESGAVISADVASPWAPARDRPALRYPLLDDVLRSFGRRTQLLLRLDAAASPAQRERVAQVLERFGLAARVAVELPLELLQQPGATNTVPSTIPSTIQWVARLDGAERNAALAQAIAGKLARGVALSGGGDEALELCQRASAAGLSSWLLPPPGRLAFPVKLLQGLRTPGAGSLAGALAGSSTEPSAQPVTVVTGAVFPALAVVRPRAVVFQDSLQAERLDTQHWAAGYSRNNGETELSASPRGLAIHIHQGREYSGGGAVTRVAFSGDFDATAGFSVSNPTQGTTFELAAIAIDPPRLSWQTGSTLALEPNLVFDVHGAAPYASSERDEDDGYRFGWNNSSNLTRILADWSHASANMFNQYTRDVGSGKARASGALRLVRTGAAFASYYADETSGGHWVCSGAASVAAMPGEVFLRLAAKHWHKGALQELPANEVLFHSFELRQP